MKNITRLSLVLSVLFLFVTSNESNASIQSQQASQQTNFNNSYLPDYTVNTIDSEEAPVQLARKWGKNKRKHSCLKKRGRYAKKYRSPYCKKYRIKKAARARANAKNRLQKRKAYKAKMRARMAQRGAPGKAGGSGMCQGRKFRGDTKKKITCLRKKLDQTPLGKTVKKGPRGIGMYGCGNPDKKKHIGCLRNKLRQQRGGKGKGGAFGCRTPDRKKHVDCLRAKLDKTPLRKTVKMGPRGLGNYGCGNPDRKKHVSCLVAKLRQQKGGKGSKRPLCNIRKGFLNPKGLATRAKECR
jgi:hypothetical protein